MVNCYVLFVDPLTLDFLCVCPMNLEVIYGNRLDHYQPNVAVRFCLIRERIDAIQLDVIRCTN